MKSQAGSAPRGRLNLRQVHSLCVDSNPQGLEILGQTLFGFGVEHNAKVTSMEAARTALLRGDIDIVLADAVLSDGSAYDLVHWLRRETRAPLRSTPVVIVTGHTQRSRVVAARDCGANFVVAKPLTPVILMERLLWTARGDRMFVECDVYAGPDRRWKHEGTPDGGKGRRRQDLSVSLGEALEPNLSQDEINDFVKPQRASL